MESAFLHTSHSCRVNWGSPALQHMGICFGAAFDNARGTWAVCGAASRLDAPINMLLSPYCQQVDGKRGLHRYTLYCDRCLVVLAGRINPISPEQPDSRSDLFRPLCHSFCPLATYFVIHFYGTVSIPDSDISTLGLGLAASSTEPSQTAFHRYRSDSLTDCSSSI